MLTKTDLAKYPFLNEATDYVKSLGLSIEDIRPEEYGPVLDRAEKRLEEALSKGRITTNIADENTEILSFPVSNLILSLTGEERAKRRYALAEAKRAYELLKQESPDKLELIASSAFQWKLRRTNMQFGRRLYDFSIGLTDYLRNAIHLKEPRWKLSNRVLDHGFVLATRDEIARLLEEEVRSKVLDRASRSTASVNVPTFLGQTIEHVRNLTVKYLGNPVHYELPRVPVPEAMPPCVRNLISLLDSGKNVQHMGRFTLASFLVNIGAEQEEIIRVFKPASDFSERMTRYQVEHIAGQRGGRTKYTCPMCTTLKTHGVCYKPDEICATIRNPLSYYKAQARTLTRGKKAVN